MSGLTGGDVGRKLFFSSILIRCADIQSARLATNCSIELPGASYGARTITRRSGRISMARVFLELLTISIFIFDLSNDDCIIFFGVLLFVDGIIGVCETPQAAQIRQLCTEIKALFSVCDILSAGEPEGACSLLANSEIVEEAYS